MHEHIQREVIDLSFSERLVEQQVFVYLSDATGYIHIQYKISYNPLTSELKFHMVFSSFTDDMVKEESRQFLLNCSYAILW